MANEPIEDTYLGDGVYASFDGYHVVLDLRGQDNFTRVVMEPQVLESLDLFRARITDLRERLTEGTDNGNSTR